MNEKKATTVKQKPAHVIRCGDIIASIHVRQSNCGFSYWHYSIQRSWKGVTTGKEAHGTTFFDNNEADIVQVVGKASAWIRDKVAHASLDKSPMAENQDES